MFVVILPVSGKENLKNLLTTLFSINRSIIKPDRVIVCFDGAQKLYKQFDLARTTYSLSLNVESVLFEKPLGLSAVLSYALNTYSSSYFARVDCGDVVFKERFKLQLEVINSNDRAFCVAGNMGYDINGKRYYNHCISKKFNQKSLLFKNVLTHSSLLVKTSIYLRIGGFNKNLSSSQDYDLYRKSLICGYDILFLNQLIGCKHFSLTGTTFSRPKDQIANTLKIYIKYFDRKIYYYNNCYIFYILFFCQ